MYQYSRFIRLKWKQYSFGIARKDLPECVVYVPVDFVGNTLIVFLFLVKYFLWFGMFSNYMMSKTVSINK